MSEPQTAEQVVLRTTVCVSVPLDRWNRIQEQFDQMTDTAWKHNEEFGVMLDALRVVCHSKTHGEAVNAAADALRAVGAA